MGLGPDFEYRVKPSYHDLESVKAVRGIDSRTYYHYPMFRSHTGFVSRFKDQLKNSTELTVNSPRHTIVEQTIPSSKQVQTDDNINDSVLSVFSWAIFALIIYSIVVTYLYYSGK